MMKRLELLACTARHHASFGTVGLVIIKVNFPGFASLKKIQESWIEDLMGCEKVEVVQKSAADVRR